MVGLASNFIVGDEVIPLDAEKLSETPLMEGIDPACVIGVSLFVLFCLFVFMLAAGLSKTTQPIFTKFGDKVATRYSVNVGTTSLNQWRSQQSHTARRSGLGHPCPCLGINHSNVRREFSDK